MTEAHTMIKCNSQGMHLETKKCKNRNRLNLLIASTCSCGNKLKEHLRIGPIFYIIRHQSQCDPSLTHFRSQGWEFDCSCFHCSYYSLPSSIEKTNNINVITLQVDNNTCHRWITRLKESADSPKTAEQQPMQNTNNRQTFYIAK